MIIRASSIDISGGEPLNSLLAPEAAREMSGILPTSSDNSGSSGGGVLQQPPPSRYESQKRRDWNTFGQYLKNHRPPLALSRCSGAHVLEFLRYLDQFGKTKVHSPTCPFFGHPHPPAPCPCPLRQAWGSLDALIGRLRAAFEENGGAPEANPFAARAVRLYLREVRDTQAKARGIAYEKKKRKRPPQPPPPPSSSQGCGIAQTSATAVNGIPSLQVADLNSAEGVLMMPHHHHHYRHPSHHGHLVIAHDGSSGGGGGGLVLAVSDSHNGSLIPLSVFN